MYNYKIQVQEVLCNGEIFGEIGVICSIPQPCAFHTIKVSQLLRLNTAVLKNIIKENSDDRRVILNNLSQVSSCLGIIMVSCFIIYLFMQNDD
jgi:hypothetical protein